MQPKGLASKSIKGEKCRKSSGVPSSDSGTVGKREVWTLNQAQGFLGQVQKIGNGGRYGPSFEHQLQTAPREIC